MLALAVIIERSFRLQRHKVAPEGLLESHLHAWGQRPAGQPSDLDGVALKTSSSLGAIMALAQQLLEQHRAAPAFAKSTLDAKAWEQEVRFEMEGLGQQLTVDLNRYLSTLSTIAPWPLFWGCWARCWA